MRAGKLFEDALKEARLKLRSGSEVKVRVSGKGRHLRLIVNQGSLTEFEASILSRSRRANESAKPYQPSVTTGERVRILRKAAGLTLDQLAKRANVTRGSLSSIERGERPLGLQVLRRIAKGLGVAVGALAND